MSHYLLQHGHEPHECSVVLAAFKGHESPLRHQATLASCRFGGHAIRRAVEAGDRTAAVLLLTHAVARTTAARANEVEIW